jgi:hypothetical protein
MELSQSQEATSSQAKERKKEKKRPAFYGTQSFIIVFTSAFHWSLS